MSGPEWTNDEPDNRDDSRPLTTPEAEPLDAPELTTGPEPKTVRIHTKAFAQPSEPAMAHASSDQDESNETSAAPRTRKGSGILPIVLSWLSKIRLPSLGSERHEMMPYAPSTPTSPGETPAHSARRAPSWFPLLSLKRETRVGIAAVLSFVVMVSALLFNRGLLGGKHPLPLALKTPTDGEAPPASEKKGEKPTEKQEKRAGEGDKGSQPSTKSVEATPSGEPPRSRLVVEGEPKAAESQSPPSGSGELPKATLLGNTPEPASPLPPLGDHQAGPPVLPSSANDPVQLPGPSPTPPVGSDPAAPPAIPKPVTPEAIPVAGPPPSTDLPSMPVVPPAASNTVQQTPPAIAEPPGPPPSTDPPAPTPPVAAEPPPIPTPSPAPPPIPTPTPSKVEPSAPVPAERPPTLESVPTAASNPPAAAALAPGTVEPAVATAAALGTGWVVIQSGGRRVVGTAPLVSSPMDVDSSPAPARAIDNPRGIDDLAIADQVEPVLHRVLDGENFWTISKLYYRSPRFYRALHAANKKQVPNIRELYVGTVLRIPPPEVLDRSLIDPPSRTSTRTEDPATSPVSRTSKRLDPADEADLAMPARPRLALDSPDPEAAKPARRPTYTVKPFETLRSIARDTLNDPKREKEIYNLNREILDDPTTPLPAGTILTLPEDATIGRRAR